MPGASLARRRLLPLRPRDRPCDGVREPARAAGKKFRKFKQELVPDEAPAAPAAPAERPTQVLGQKVEEVFTAVPGVKSIYQYSADEPNPFEFVKPDDEWIDEKFNALGWFLDKYIYFAAVLVLITGGVAATAYNDGAEQYVPPGGDTGAGEEIASKMLF
mmetsp:Transcript_2993/g.12105  ORF Transcript_2993/g.12105 Transcript_2993/m.12105 type:complete len:160 (-) Transcript_2993:29-508(-)